MYSKGLVLVVNAGSSSLKFSLFQNEAVAGLRLAVNGVVERIGDEQNSGISLVTAGEKRSKVSEQTPIPDHRVALDTVLERLRESTGAGAEGGVGAVGHRVVHGGTLSKSMLLSPAVLDAIDRAAIFAPLHNPANAQGIRAAQALFGDSTPQVAVFDTAFHQTMPARAYTYALPQKLCEEHHIRRYGAHGTSYRYLVQKAAQVLGRAQGEMNMVVCHLGAGASVACIRAGQSIDTSMGLTPLEGLVMASRCGDVDPSVPLYLQKHCGLSAREVDTLLNKESGLAGICGSTDLRSVLTDDSPQAKLAVEVFIHRLRKYLGAYLLQLADCDDVCIVFSAGIGENSALIRSLACQNLQQYGISIDETKNAAAIGVVRDISGPDSRIKVLVLPTNEELSIAEQTLEVLAK